MNLSMTASTIPLEILRAAFGDALQQNVPLAPYTSARIGGPADVMITVKSGNELAKTAARLQDLGLDFVMLGGGANVLVSDRGVRQVVVLNRAKAVRFHEGDRPRVWAESGATFSQLAHRAATKSLAGPECWAVPARSWRGLRQRRRIRDVMHSLLR
jgi:UDP-N-acetylmuramate dehydrogenase